MSRSVYSDILGVAQSVGDGGALLGTVPEGYTWVVRFAAATFGSYLAYANACLYRNNEDPRLWLMSNQSGSLFSDHPTTFYWEGRMVLIQGDELWAQASSGDTCDVYVSGYTLSNP